MIKQLYTELEDDAIFNKKVFLDGPYGGTVRDPTSFDNVVLMATGSGVTATLPSLSTIANEIQQAKKDENLLIRRNINFFWLISCDDLKWNGSELYRCLNIAADCINTDIYICHGKYEQQQNSHKIK